VSDFEFNTYLEEAEINYNNQRYKDAAGTFEYLIRASTRESNFLDVIHFSYRAIDAWEKAGSTQKALHVWKNLGVFSLKVASKIASDSAQETTNLEYKTEILEILQDTLDYLNNADYRRIILEDLYQHYILLSQEYDRSLKERIMYLEKTMNYPDVLTDERIKYIETNLAELHFKLAKQYSQSNQLGADNMAKKELEIANEILQKYGSHPRVL